MNKISIAFVARFPVIKLLPFENPAGICIYLGQSLMLVIVENLTLGLYPLNQFMFTRGRLCWGRQFDFDLYDLKDSILKKTAYSSGGAGTMSQLARCFQRENLLTIHL